MDEPERYEPSDDVVKGKADVGNDGYMMVGMGNAYVQRNQLPEARITFKQVLERFPDSEPAQLARQNLEKLKSKG